MRCFGILCLTSSEEYYAKLSPFLFSLPYPLVVFSADFKVIFVFCENKLSIIGFKEILIVYKYVLSKKPASKS